MQQPLLDPNKINELTISNESLHKSGVKLTTNICERCKKSYESIRGLKAHQNFYCKLTHRKSLRARAVNKVVLSRLRIRQKTSVQEKRRGSSSNKMDGFQCDQCTQQVQSIIGLKRHRRILHCNAPPLSATDFRRLYPSSTSNSALLPPLKVKQTDGRKSFHNLRNILLRNKPVNKAINSKRQNTIKCNLCTRQFKSVLSCRLHCSMAHLDLSSLMSTERELSSTRQIKPSEQRRTSKSVQMKTVEQKRMFKADLTSSTRTSVYRSFKIIERDQIEPKEIKVPVKLLEKEDEDLNKNNNQLDSSSEESDSDRFQLTLNYVPALQETSAATSSKTVVKRRVGRPSNASKMNNKLTLGRRIHGSLDVEVLNAKLPRLTNSSFADQSQKSELSGAQHSKLKQKLSHDLDLDSSSGRLIKNTLSKNKLFKSVPLVNSRKLKEQHYKNKSDNSGIQQEKQAKVEISEQNKQFETNVKIVTKSVLNHVREDLVENGQSQRRPKLGAGHIRLDKFLVVKLRRCDENWKKTKVADKVKMLSQRPLSDVKKTDRIEHQPLEKKSRVVSSEPTSLLYRCKDCVKAFYTVNLLKEHRLLMHIPFSAQYRCGVCFAMFETLSEVRSCFYGHSVQSSDLICLD